MSEHVSDVARIRARIDLEIEALQWLKSGLVKCASHEAIMNHYRALDSYHDQLARHVGEEQATDEICERMNTIQ